MDRPLDATPATVLLVDDQLIIAESVRQLLATEPGVRLHHCADPQRAIAMALEVSPTVILQDLVMPGVDGLDLVAQFRAHEGTRHVPLIVLSMKDEPAVKAEAFRRGANDYLVKLPSGAELQARVKYHSSAYVNACQSRSAFEALRESREQLRVRNEEIRRQRDVLARQAQELGLRNEFIRKTFGRYLSDEVVRRLLETPDGLELGGESRLVTLLMSDLRGFTALAERLTPAQVVRLLNNYLGAMADVISAYRGTIDEFIGDAILALFGAPERGEDDAARAVACAVAMQRAMADVNAWNEREGLPLIEMGIALHTGEVVVGNIGSMARAKYGAVGSNVNLTSRIETCTVGGQILVSQSTLDAAGPTVEVGPSLRVAAKGFAAPIVAHDLRGIGGLHAIWLPSREDTLMELPLPVPVRFGIVLDKQVAPEWQDGVLTSMSRRRGDLSSSVHLPPLTNLCMRVLQEDGTEIPEDMYGKVVSSDPAGPATVHFTSPSPLSLAYLERRLPTTTP